MIGLEAYIAIFVSLFVVGKYSWKIETKEILETMLALSIGIGIGEVICYVCTWAMS